MNICIMHFASSLLTIFSAKFVFQELVYGELVLSRCCFHHHVENSILYKKDSQHFYIETIFFSVGGKVDGQILFGARSEKCTNLFGAK